MKLVKPSGEAERATQTTVDTIEVTRRLAASWKSPPFQRDMRVNQKVVELIEDVRRNGVLPGVLTLGVLDGEVYVVDGQHRVGAFTAADIPVCYADVRTHHFRTMAAMAEEFVRLNSQLVSLRPDDILKGLEQSNPHLQRIRKKCPFVGYDMVRRSEKAPIVSMSMLMRLWAGTRVDTPSTTTGGSAATAAGNLDEQETTRLIEFLSICFEAWGRDAEYARLWGSLNLILCAWLYRRVVDGHGNTKATSRSTRLEPDQFRRCLMALSSDENYIDYLANRRVTDRDRAPAYNRIKAIFARRYHAEHNTKMLLPSPSWAHQASGRR